MIHHVDPNVANLTMAAATPILERGIRKLLEKVHDADNILSADFEIIDKEMTLLCPDQIQKYSLIVYVKKNGLIGKKIDFRNGNVRRVSIRSINGLKRIPAITINEQGFTLNLGMLPVGEKYILEIDYFLNDDEFIDALVDRQRPKETPSQESNRFWMVAQLRHPEALKGEYGRLDLFDVDFSVDVGVDQDLDTKIPNIFRSQLQQLAKIAGPLGRDELFKEYFKFRNIKNKKYGKEALELLGQLQKLFLPDRFSKFVAVEDDFHYSQCMRGVSEFDVPLSWPRKMTVVSRTDLTLDKPTARGYLVYKKSSFLEEVSKIFE